MKKGKNLHRWIIIIPAAVLVILLTVLFWFYNSQKNMMRSEAEKKLQTIASLKITQIIDWRAERLEDAWTIMESPFLRQTMIRWLPNPQVKDTEHILDYFRSRRYKKYSYISLIDANGKVCLSLSGQQHDSLHAETLRILPEALHDHRPIFTDLHLGSGSLTPHINIIAPFFAGQGKTANPVGTVVLQIDANQFLYPLIQLWPLPSKTAETLLVRREGDNVLFLNDLRYQENTALNLHFPLSQIDLPAAIAVQGTEGVVYGRDYRGIKVLSVLKAIPDSPWFMVAKIDEAEALDVWHGQSTLILLILIGIVATTSFAVAGVWQRKQKMSYQNLFQAEQELTKKHNLLLTIINNLPDLIFVKDTQSRFLLANDALAHSFAVSKPEELLGKTDFDYAPPELAKQYSADDQKIFSSGMPVINHEEILIDNTTGEQKWLLTTKVPFWNEQGELLGLVGIGRDITERKQAEQALKESERRFSDVANNANEFIWEVDINGKYTYANQIVEKILGYTSEEILQKHFYDQFHPDDRDVLKEGAFATFASKQPFQNFINRNLHKNGQTKWLTTSGVPLLDDKGNLLGYRGSDTDITERKWAEERILASEGKYRTLSNNIPGMIYRSGADWLAEVVINSKEVCGYSPDEFDHKKMKWLDLIHPDDKQGIIEEASKIEIKPISIIQEYRIISKDGKIRWVSDHKTSLFNDDESYKGVDGIVFDITEQKNSEEQMQNDLQEKTLLLSEVHHRVKNSLQVVSSLLHLQSLKIKDKQALDLIEQSRNRVYMMASVYEKLYQSKNFASISYKEYLEDVLNNVFLSSGMNHRISFKLNVKNVVLGLDDAVPVALIINELFTNSIKHAFPGNKKGKIEINFYYLNEDSYQLIYRDNGVGFSDHINFDNTETLGLHLIKNLAEQISGNATFEQTEWTTFKIVFKGYDYGKTKYSNS
jgi:PAS domain S-box-containing protein